jgi:hypothetical protein
VQWHHQKLRSNNQENNIQTSISTQSIASTQDVKSIADPATTSVASQLVEHEQTEKIQIEDDLKEALVKPSSSSTNQTVKQETTHQKIIQKVKKQARKVAVPMDGELVINIILMIVFLGLSILFLMLALKATGIMLFVYWGLCALSFILFVTQLIDVIMW